MKAATALTLVVPAALMLAGCDWISGAGSSSDTAMTNVEILPGTASDEMITLDQASGDGTAIDTSTAVGPGEPSRGGAEDATDAQGDAATASAGASDSTATSSDGPAADADTPTQRRDDEVIRPPAENTKR